MNDTTKPTPEQLRQALADSTLRPRDLAASLGVSEADLLAARVDGDKVTRISADPDNLLPGVETLGPVMALTRNESIVSEVEGSYGGYRPGEHAGLVLGDGIDLRIFRRHWVHGFTVVAETKAGPRLSFQVFDAAGDAVHKIYLPKGAEPEGWLALRDALRLKDQSPQLETTPRAAVEAPILRPEVTEALRGDWAGMGDSHKFPALMRKHKINRLGAYRIVGAPYARRLEIASVGRILDRLAETGTPSMIFVGNAGCIQIFSGPIGPIKTMGPWLNVLDPGFDMHLRGDHITEVWAVEKPSRRGPAVSIEFFDAQGALIAQVFGLRSAEGDHYPAWLQLVEEETSRLAEEVPA
ncbi:putative hemin transport protein [Pseudooceanicola antarcticus]|uniref:Hemin-degrading factor n=1 Tax=Pseudooceanicola antarcticus TaxID=1247613 RepID=A0A285IK89_9RHOB|nr:ChuX/HutX family heme-like substrate-binding protein [Pseudooceanicola antarcticus]PJE28765.1 hemin-degrading factor [Pseudooceanicola antarcticus]SNY48323.1 putative hemin transport protein [Pseudooceanicola antarcticus]